MAATEFINDRFKVSGLLARRLGEHQVSVPAVLRRAGLPAGFFQQEKIYAATARLSAQGGTVVLGARRADRLKAFANELTLAHGKAVDWMEKVIDEQYHK